MSLKIRLISCISAFILVLSMLFIGVYAAQSVELNVGGSVSFTASSVYADITGSYVGTMEHPSTAKELTPIHITADTTDGAASMPNDWTSMPLNFDESGSPITVTITIQNLASDRAIAVSLTDNTNITGVNVARTYNSSSFSGITSSQTINGGESGTFTFTLSLSSVNNDISGAFDVDLDLTATEQVTGHTVTIDVTEVLGGWLTPVYIRINGGDEEEIREETSRIYSNVESIQIGGHGTNEMIAGWIVLRISGDISKIISLGANSTEYSDVYNVTEDMNLSVSITSFSLQIQEIIPEYTSVVSDFDVSYNDDDNTAMIWGYNGSETAVAVPASISFEGKNYTVTSIGEYNGEIAYFDNSIEHLYIPPSVEYVNISTPSNLQSIIVGGSYENPSQLKSYVGLDLGYSPLKMVDFSWCNYLTEVVSRDVNFENIFMLTTIYVGKGMFIEGSDWNVIETAKFISEELYGFNIVGLLVHELVYEDAEGEGLYMDYLAKLGYEYSYDYVRDEKAINFDPIYVTPYFVYASNL